MTAALKNLSRDTLLRMLSGLWPKYHADLGEVRGGEVDGE